MSSLVSWILRASTLTRKAIAEPRRTPAATARADNALLSMGTELDTPSGWISDVQGCWLCVCANASDCCLLDTTFSCSGLGNCSPATASIDRLRSGVALDAYRWRLLSTRYTIWRSISTTTR